MKTITRLLVCLLALLVFVQLPMCHAQLPTQLAQVAYQPTTLPGDSSYYRPVDAFRQRVISHLTYPLLATKANQEGTVWVRIWINPNGMAEQAGIVRSAGPILDRTVLKAVYAVLPWQFAQPNQYAKGRSLDYPIKFRLD